MSGFPYFKIAICLCVIIVGVISFFPSVTERRYYPYSPQTFYYDVTVYPYRFLGSILIIVGVTFGMVIIANPRGYKLYRAVVRCCIILGPLLAIGGLPFWVFLNFTYRFNRHPFEYYALPPILVGIILIALGIMAKVLELREKKRVSDEK